MVDISPFVTVFQGLLLAVGIGVIYAVIADLGTKRGSPPDRTSNG